MRRLSHVLLPCLRAPPSAQSEHMTHRASERPHLAMPVAPQRAGLPTSRSPQNCTCARSRRRSAKDKSGPCRCSMCRGGDTAVPRRGVARQPQSGGKRSDSQMSGGFQKYRSVASAIERTQPAVAAHHNGIQPDIQFVHKNVSCANCDLPGAPCKHPMLCDTSMLHVSQDTTAPGDTNQSLSRYSR